MRPRDIGAFYWIYFCPNNSSRKKEIKNPLIKPIEVQPKFNFKFAFHKSG